MVEIFVCEYSNLNKMSLYESYFKIIVIFWKWWAKCKGNIIVYFKWNSFYNPQLKLNLIVQFSVCISWTFSSVCL